MSAENQFLPKPIDIAHRVAHISGDLGLDLAFDPGQNARQVYFDIDLQDEERALASATVVVESAFDNKSEYAVNSTEIGHYDPATQQWKFYPEIVSQEGQDELGKYFDAQYEKLSWAESFSLPNSNARTLYRHPLTVLAREQTAELLAKTDLAQRVIDDHPANILRPVYTFDQATSCYVSLTPAGLTYEEIMYFMEHGTGVYEPLTITYRGLREKTEGSIKRVTQQFLIARRSIEDGEWEFHPDFVDEAEQEHLPKIAELLKGHADKSRLFSVVHNAVLQDKTNDTPPNPMV